MTQFVFIVLCALSVTIYSAELKCGFAEVEDQCPADCDSDSCPENDNYSRTCETPKDCPAPACKCRFDYSRANNGTCIPTRECPAFPCIRPNEQFVSCPSYCPTDDCSQATPDGRCPIFGNILTVLECRPACRCKHGYWRNKGVCVPFAECPGKKSLVGKEPLMPFWNIFT